MKGEPLELDLWEQLRQAQQMPEQANLGKLLEQVEGAIGQMSDQEQLQWVGEALLRVAEVCAIKAEVLLTQWEEASRDPIVETGFFSDLVRQTMAVDLSELMEPTPARKPRTKRAKSATTEEVGSIAAPVDKGAVLAMVEQMERETEMEQQQVWAIAHEENVSRWVEAIAQCLQEIPTHRVLFAGLCQSLGMPRVEAWLGALLGEFALEQEGEFYGNQVWIGLPESRDRLGHNYSTQSS